MPVKLIFLALVFALVLGGGYWFFVKDLYGQVERVAETEQDLRDEYREKAHRVANLDRYKAQMVEMEESFGALVSQLPSDTEVPGLLEDITNKGLLNGLAIKSIKLQKERSREFYVELPISISAVGSYHDLGAFISGMASLPRIVTLHDFNIGMQDKNANRLNLNITAKTYRYKDDEGA